MGTSVSITTLGALKRAVSRGFVRRSVKNEVRDNLIHKMRRTDELFPGIIGYDDTVIPQLVNAILSRHNFILLGLRGPGEEPDPARPDRPARRRDPGDPGLRDQRRSARADLRGLPRAGGARGRRDTGRVAPA